ncbi:MAG: terminase family protein [Candidatus Dojkabacteria bacterium]|nr:terminase family protein [Candidatus Dojkabacteria bacterium]
MPIKYDDQYILKPGRKFEFTPHMLQEVAKCSQNIFYFAEKYYKIIHPIRGEEIISLYDYQKELLYNFTHYRHNIVLSGRQLGKTTCAAIYILWFSLFNQSKNIAILANKQSTAISIIDDIKKGYEGLPAWLKLGVKKYDQLEIKFENESRIFARATNPDAIRGESVSLLFLDEFAFVPENIAEDFWVANYPTLSTGGNIIIVSTPNGAAGKFYELWKMAIRGENNFWKATKIPWNKHPERDQKWKEEQLAAMGKVKFAQEHECSFTGSSNTLIDGDILETLNPKKPRFFPEEGFYIWNPPEEKHVYIVSVDVAKGSNTDFHVANVFDVTFWSNKQKYEQVAIFRRNDISIFEFKNKILEICKRYNNALVIIENNNLGHTIVNNLFYDDGYENIWYDYDRQEYGINSNIKTKPLALTYFKDDVEKQRLIINSSDMINELSYFEEVKTGIFQARVGKNFHDDIVATGYWAAFCLRSRCFEDYVYYILQKENSFNENNIEDEKILNSFIDNFDDNFDKEMQKFKNELEIG